MDDSQIRPLVAAALTARGQAYAPYSQYRVGAALLTAAGKIYTGCNIENAAFSPTLCAERVALAKAISEGERDFAALCIAADTAAPAPPAYPCGVCRQALIEFCAGDFLVIAAHSADDYRCFTLGQLLPHHFGPEQLKP